MVDHVIAFLTAIGAYTTILLIAEAVRTVHKKIRARRRRRPSDWRMSLLVSVDEDDSLIRPSVQLRGDAVPRSARLQLKLLDDREKTRVSLSRLLPEGAANREFELNPFHPPAGSAVDDVLRWEWVVILKSHRRKLRQWKQRLGVLEGFNAEAEISSIPI